MPNTVWVLRIVVSNLWEKLTTEQFSVIAENIEYFGGTDRLTGRKCQANKVKKGVVRGEMTLVNSAFSAFLRLGKLQGGEQSCGGAAAGPQLTVGFRHHRESRLPLWILLTTDIPPEAEQKHHGITLQDSQGRVGRTV